MLYLVLGPTGFDEVAGVVLCGDLTGLAGRGVNATAAGGGCRTQVYPRPQDKGNHEDDEVGKEDGKLFVEPEIFAYLYMRSY